VATATISILHGAVPNGGAEIHVNNWLTANLIYKDLPIG
jgi:hypothetical protein